MMKARDNMLKGRYDDRIQNECLLARALMSEFPAMVRGDALREAARLLERAP